MQPKDAAPLERTDLVTAAVLVLAAVAVQLVGAGKPWLAFPVTATFTRPPETRMRSSAELMLAEASVPVATVQLPTAVALLLTFIAVMRLLWLVPGIRNRRRVRLDADRHLPRWIEYSQVGGIVGFLVAQLNGITEVTSLVPIYALGAGVALLLVLHDRRTVEGRRGLPAFSFGAALGVVPWGVIAFAQIGGTLAGVGVSVPVRIVTVAALLGLTAVWFVVWLFGRGARSRTVALRLDGMLSLTVPLAAMVLAAYVLLA
jgi:Heliorhodopsin